MSDAEPTLPAPRAIGLSPELHGYLLAHANPAADPVSERLAETTAERFGAAAAMNIGADQGRLLQWLVELTGARTVVEVGTFTGMSALWLARGLPPDGRLLCFELVDDYLATARAAWSEAGVDERITVTLGPAADSLAALPDDLVVDLAFIDADKRGYATYLELLLPRMADDGLVIVDNVLWSGTVVDPSVTDADTEAIRAFNDMVAARDDCEALMLGVGDGITLIRPRPPAS